jgi:hypothetical protein
MKQSFIDIEDEHTKRDALRSNELQSRCMLRYSSLDEKNAPQPTFKMVPQQPKPIKSEPTVQPEQTTAKENANAAPRGPKRRIPRPTSMLRPKVRHRLEIVTPFAYIAISSFPHNFFPLSNSLLANLLKDLRCKQ